MSSIKRKEKECVSCGAIKQIYARGMCPLCYQNDRQKEYAERARNKPQKKRKAIKPISTSMAKKLAKYRPLRDEYMKQHPNCEFEGCNKPSQDLHHKARRGENLCNVETFMAVCRTHHIWIEDNHAKAKELGYLM